LGLSTTRKVFAATLARGKRKEVKTAQRLKNPIKTKKYLFPKTTKIRR